MVGICVLDDSTVSLYYFQLCPIVSSTVLGITVFLIGLRKLIHLRSEFIYGQMSSTFKLEKFLIRILAFSLIFIIPRIFELLLKMHLTTISTLAEETWYHDNCLELNLPCPSALPSPNVYIPPLYLTAKYMMLIMPAWAPLVWVVNGKSLRGWGMNSTRNQPEVTNASDTTSQESFEKSSVLSNSRNSRTDSELATT